MINITIVAVGNLKEKFSVDAESEYLKRLSAFCKIKVTEIKEFNKLQNIELIKEKEGEEILKHISGYPILLDIGGESMSSEALSKNIEKLSLSHSSLTFIIGGSYGVSDKVRNVCKQKISFSKMTFPHNMFRIMLLEQLYRAFTIINGKSYHK